MNSAEMQQVVRQYIVTELMQGQDKGLDAATPLLELGIIDSLSMVSLVSFLEDRFSVKLTDVEMNPANFTNLESLTQLLVRMVKS